MKKMIIAGIFLLSVAAIHATNNKGKLRSDAVMYNHNSSYVVRDTVPEDTTADSDSTDSDTDDTDTSAQTNLSWNIVRDTVPSDTTQPDTTKAALSFNYNMLRDTVPADTTKPDSTTTLTFNFSK